MPSRSSRASVDGQGGRRFAPITGIDLTWGGTRFRSKFDQFTGFQVLNIADFRRLVLFTLGSLSKRASVLANLDMKSVD